MIQTGIFKLQHHFFWQIFSLSCSSPQHDHNLLALRSALVLNHPLILENLSHVGVPFPHHGPCLSQPTGTSRNPPADIDFTNMSSDRDERKLKGLAEAKRLEIAGLVREIQILTRESKMAENRSKVLWILDRTKRLLADLRSSTLEDYAYHK